MRGSYVHAALAFEMTDGEAYLGCWAQALKQIHLDAVGGEDVSHRFGKHAAVVAAVMTNHYGNPAVLNMVKAILALHLEQIVGIALCGARYYVFVHAVSARAHNAAQTASAEFQSAVESVDELRLIISFHHFLYSGFGLGIVVAVKPRLRSAHNLLQKFVFHVLFIEVNDYYRFSCSALLMSSSSKVNILLHTPYDTVFSPSVTGSSQVLNIR